MIRRIRTEDAAAIRSLCESALGHKAAEERIVQQIAQLSQEPAYYIAVFEGEEDHAVKGFIQAQDYRLLYGGNGWNVIALAMEPQAQRSGIGRQLLASLEMYARENGAAFIRLNSGTERTEAHAFYEHLGYRCDKLQKRFIKDLGEVDES